MQTQKIVEFEISELLGIGMTLVILGIGVAYGLQIMGETRDDVGVSACAKNVAYPAKNLYNDTSKLCYNSTGGTVAPATTEWNASTSSIEGVAKIPEKLPTIATVIVASVIIGILVTYLWGRFANA